MSSQLLLLFTAASALCCTAIVTASGYVHNEYASNHNNAIITKQRQNHPQEARELKLQLQQQQQVQHFQPEGPSTELFEPLDFANLRGLQQINEYYDGNNNNNYNDRAKNGQNELLQQEPHVQDDSKGIGHDDDGTNSNSNSNGKTPATNNYYFYKYNEDDTDKEINSNGNSHSQKQRILTGPWQQQSQNPHKRAVLTPGHRLPSFPAAQETPQQDTKNDFRLQLSALNDAAGTTGDNAGKGNQLPDIASNSKFSYQDGVAAGTGLSIVRRSQSFADDDFAESESDKPNPAALFNANSLDFHQINDEADSHDSDDELGMELPYGIQNTARKRDVRGAANSEHHGRSTSYQSLCLTKRLTIPLETAGYEYRPNHYIEVTCKHYYDPTPSATQNAEFNHNRVCSEVGFSCIQLNRTIHLIRRSKASTADCWESEIRIVPSGCECMWPMHEHGDIIPYHTGQKRYNPLAMAQQNPSSTAGISYRMMPRQLQLLGSGGRLNNGFQAYDAN